MNQKDQVMDNGDTPGFIDRYLSKKQIVQNAIRKKAEASFADESESQPMPQYSAPTPKAQFAASALIAKAKPTMPTMIAQQKKIEPAKIAQLDLNTIGDSDDTVTALQEQLKKAEKEELMKIEMKKALTEKLTAKKEEAAPATPAAPAQNTTATAQKTKESENTATEANTNNQEQTTITEIKSDGITLHKVEKAKKPAAAPTPAANATASAAVQKSVEKEDKIPDVTVDDMEKASSSIENPLAVLWGQKHPEIMKNYSERQYESESWEPNAHMYLMSSVN